MIKVESIVKVLKLYGSTIEKVAGNKIMTSCPFARWTHSGGVDRRPSFTIFMGRKSIGYNCFSCGEKGHIYNLVWKMQSLHRKAFPLANFVVYDPMSGNDYLDVSSLEYNPGGKFVGEAAIVNVDIEDTEYDEKYEAQMLSMVTKKKEYEYEPPTEDEIRDFSSNEIPSYMKDRGISEGTYKEWELGNDIVNRRVTFPVRDWNGKLIGITARLYWEKQYCFRCGKLFLDMKPRCRKCGQRYEKYLHSYKMPRGLLLFGAYKHKGDGPVVLVEGPIDVIKLWENSVRYPVAFLGFPKIEQVKKAFDLSDDVIMIGDGDDAGRRMNGIVSEMARMLSKKVQVVELPDGTDPGDLAEIEARNRLPERAFSC